MCCSLHVCLIHVIWTECWISKLVLNVQHLLFLLFFNFVRVLQFGAYSRHYKGVLTQKRSFIVICTDFRSNLHVGWKNHNKHSTLMWSVCHKKRYLLCVEMTNFGIFTKPIPMFFFWCTNWDSQDSAETAAHIA